MATCARSFTTVQYRYNRYRRSGVFPSNFFAVRLESAAIVSPKLPKARAPKVKARNPWASCSTLRAMALSGAALVGLLVAIALAASIIAVLLLDRCLSCKWAYSISATALQLAAAAAALALSWPSSRTPVVPSRANAPPVCRFTAPTTPILHPYPPYARVRSGRIGHPPSLEELEAAEQRRREETQEALVMSGTLMPSTPTREKPGCSSCCEADQMESGGSQRSAPPNSHSFSAQVAEADGCGGERGAPAAGEMMAGGVAGGMAVGGCAAAAAAAASSLSASFTSATHTQRSTSAEGEEEGGEEEARRPPPQQQPPPQEQGEVTDPGPRDAPAAPNDSAMLPTCFSAGLGSAPAAAPPPAGTASPARRRRKQRIGQPGREESPPVQAAKLTGAGRRRHSLKGSRALAPVDGDDVHAPAGASGSADMAQPAAEAAVRDGNGKPARPRRRRQRVGDGGEPDNGGAESAGGRRRRRSHHGTREAPPRALRSSGDGGPPVGDADGATPAGTACLNGEGDARTKGRKRRSSKATAADVAAATEGSGTPWERSVHAENGRHDAGDDGFDSDQLSC